MSNIDSFTYLHISPLTLQYGGQTFRQSWKLDRSSLPFGHKYVILSFFHFFLGATVNFHFALRCFPLQSELRANNIHKKR